MSLLRLPLGQVTDLLTDGTHYTPLDVGGGIPFLTVKDVSEDGLDFAGCSRISENDYAAADKQNSAPKRGDVLFSKDGTVGKVHLVKEDHRFAVLSSLAILRPSKKIDGGYLAHFLRTPSALDAASRKKTGSAIRRIVLRDLSSLEIPVPSLDEQRRIAAILDKADSLRRKRKRSLYLVDSLTQSIFVDMFGSGNYPIRELKDVVKKGTIVTYGIVQAGPEFSDGIPYIRTGDIIDGAIKRDNLRLTNPAIAARFSRSRVEVGDIVMSIRATVGTTAVVPAELDGANLTQGTARIVPGESVRVDYLLEYLRSADVQQWIKAQVKGATFLEITLRRLRELPVAVPSLEKQLEFSKRVTKVKENLRSHRQQLAKLESLFSSLQHRAFTGQL